MADDVERLRTLALEGIAQSTAHSTIGIFPLRTVKADGTVAKERTPFEDGWNKCHREHSQKVDRIRAWLKGLSDTHRLRVEDLLIKNHIELFVEGDKVSMSVDCSDLFFWGCSDTEEISFSELKELDDCLALTTYGGELWCCRKRNMRPQAAVYKAYLPSAVHKLFDDAGPERNDADGKK